MDRKVALQLRNEEPWREMTGMMAKAGFKYVAMSFGDERPLLEDNWREYVSDIDRVFKENGLKCVMTHAPYYHLLVSAEQRDPKMELAMARCIEATSMLGAEICVVHPRSFIIPNMPREEAVDRARSLEENIISFKPLVEECEKFGVKLGIENLMKYPHEHPWFYSYLVDDQIELIDKLDSENVCGVWDFGHANLCDEDQAERIRKMGKRIMGTHVHNNTAIHDCHFPPFYPDPSAYYIKRAVNWDSVMEALGETEFDGYLTLEIIFHFNYSTEALIRYVYDNICELDKIARG